MIYISQAPISDHANTIDKQTHPWHFAMFVENDRVLIILAHPDDEVLGCGGLIAKYAENIHFKVSVSGTGGYH